MANGINNQDSVWSEIGKRRQRKRGGIISVSGQANMASAARPRGTAARRACVAAFSAAARVRIVDIKRARRLYAHQRAHRWRYDAACADAASAAVARSCGAGCQPTCCGATSRAAARSGDEKKKISGQRHDA
jgi:hypothetical protein